MSQFYKFLLLGAFSTLVDYLVYSSLILLSVNYIIAITLGYSLGLMFNFFIGRWLIFTSGKKLTKFHQEFLGIIVIAIGGLLLNVVIVKVLSYMVFHISPFYSRMVSIGVVFFWNYYMRKIFVYH